MENRISSIKGTRKKKAGIAIFCLIMLSIMTIGGLYAIQAQSPPAIQSQNKFDAESGLGFSSLPELTEPLQKIGLTFINVGVYPPTTDNINWSNPHIGKLSQNEPIRITSEADVDLLLEAVRVANALRTGGMSFDTCIVPNAIEDAGLYDYWMNGIRQINQPARERALIDLATNNTLDELVEKGLFLRPGMMKEFQALGFFPDEPESFQTFDGLTVTGQNRDE